MWIKAYRVEIEGGEYGYISEVVERYKVISTSDPFAFETRKQALSDAKKRKKDIEREDRTRGWY